MAQFYTKLWNEMNQKISGLEAVVKQFQEKAIIVSNAAVARIKIMEPKLDEVHEFVLAAKKPLRAPAFADVEVQVNPSTQKKSVSPATGTKIAAHHKKAPTSAVAKSASPATVTKTAAKRKKAAKSVSTASVTKSAETRKQAPLSAVAAKSLQAVSPIGEAKQAAEGQETACATKESEINAEQTRIANQNANHYLSGFHGETTEDEDDQDLSRLISSSKLGEDEEE